MDTFMIKNTELIISCEYSFEKHTPISGLFRRPETFLPTVRGCSTERICTGVPNSEKNG